MKIPISFILVAAFLTTSAQEFQNRDLQQMVDTERAFAAMAKEKNRRDAFLFYLSEDVITSGPKGPQKGKAEIEKQLVTNDWLYWEVAFCDIASSGDFGYNTGPYEYRVNKTDEKPVGYGQFNSIWKKQADGSWKNVLDIGTRHGATEEKVKTVTSKKALSSLTRKNKLSKEDFFKVEREFVEFARTSAIRAYQKFLSDESRLVHSRYLPLIGKEKQENYLKDFVWPQVITLVDGELASSMDMGYVYGTGEVQDANEKRYATYVRVWKREGKKWKIVLDVLSY